MAESEESSTNKSEQQQTESVSCKVATRCDVDDSASSCSDKSFEAGVDTEHGNTGGQSGHRRCHRPGVKNNPGAKKHGKRRHKGGSRHKRHNQLYYSMRDDVQLQRKQIALQQQEKENAAAIVRQEGEEQFVIYPTAPFNSTQFLMEEHSEHLAHEERQKSAGSSVPGSPQQDRISSLPLTPVESNYDGIHFQKRDQEFTDSYVSAQAECLHSLPKEELVKHFMHLEEKVAALQRKVAEAEYQQQQEQNQEEEDLSSRENRRVHNPRVLESVYNSETNSLSSNNEEFVDLSQANQRPVFVEEFINVEECEPNQPICDDTVSSSTTHSSPSHVS